MDSFQCESILLNRDIQKKLSAYDMWSMIIKLSSENGSNKTTECVIH